jgi:hypothetical protein
VGVNSWGVCMEAVGFDAVLTPSHRLLV